MAIIRSRSSHVMIGRGSGFVKGPVDVLRVQNQLAEDGSCSE